MESRKKKSGFGKGVLVGALLMMLICLLVFCISSGIIVTGRSEQAVPEEKEAVQDQSGLNFNKILSKAQYIQDIIDQYFLFDEDYEKVEDGIYQGLMYGLDDPYSVYYNEDDYDSLIETTSGSYFGIGAIVSQDVSTGVMTIIKVYDGTPALEAGMLPGDILYMVSGEPVTGMELDIVVKDHIRGEEGTFVDITVLRGENNEEVELTVERRQIELPTVTYEMLDDDVGYIIVTEFDEVTTEQFKSAVDDLTDQGMEALLIDLRDNPGGILDTAVEMLAYLLPEDKYDGMLIYTEDKNGDGEKYYCKDGELRRDPSGGRYPLKDDHEVEVPIAVLINGNSASAAELFTGAIKDYGAGIAVGTTSFGKGIVQSLIGLGDGTAIKLTTSHYYTPSGYDIHEKGIEPDVEVELDEELKMKAVIEQDEDNQLQAALEALKDIK